VTLAPGARLGPYEIVSLLGSGGMGEVYRGRDPRLDRDVAIKVLPEPLAGDTDSQARFEREAKAAASVSHSHICPIFDVGQHGQFRFIVMEYLDGESLADRIGRGMVPLETAIEYASQIAEALAEAHRHRIVHRDLKPSNVMLVRSGVKIVDFGVAKLRPAVVDDNSSVSTALPDTGRGTLLGTLQYMAPEQVAGSEVDDSADVFALGVLLYEMVTGVAPFSADSKAGTIAAILDREPPAAGCFNPRVPADLEALIAECLAKEQRYRPTAEVAAQRLHAVADVKRSRQTPHHPRSRGKTVRSMAVLPFVTTLKDEAEDVFADGMAEGLIASLGSLPTLRVISRSSMRRYKATALRASEIAAELRVDALLTGEIVQNDSGFLSVSTELIDAVDEACLWSGRYRCERSEVLNVEEQIVHSIAARMRLSSALKPRASRKRRLNPDSHEAYLKGKFQFENRLGHWLEGSFDSLSTAIRHDRTFAPAHAALSRWFVVAALRAMSKETPSRFTIDWREGCRKAEEEARHAVKLDPTLAEAHAALAQVLLFRWRFEEAEAAYRQSLALGPSIAFTHGSYSEFLNITNRPDDAIAHAEIAKAYDPFATYVYERLACALYAARRFEDCLETCRDGLELSPAGDILHYVHGLALGFTGQFDAAVESLEIACTRMSSNVAARASLAAMLVRGSRHDQATRILEELQREDANPVTIAEVYVAMGRFQDALDNLERAFESESPQILGVAADPAYAALHAHPRFRRLLNGLGLSSYFPAATPLGT